MDREEALRLLSAYLDQYRKLSYTDLAAKVGDEEFPTMVGPSGTEYQMEIQIRWDHKSGGDIEPLLRITVQGGQEELDQAFPHTGIEFFGIDDQLIFGHRLIRFSSAPL